MSVNRAKPHVMVLPEDDADRELAKGFETEVSTRQIQVLAPAGGWLRALELITTEHAGPMRRHQNRHLVLVIDFDNDVNRIAFATTKIPDDLKDRVYVLGSLSDPEKLRDRIGLNLESIGRSLAQGCRANADVKWADPLLAHNAAELERLRTHVRPILFS